MCIIVTYYYKKTEHQKNCIMKIKGPFVKVVSLNEIIKHPLFQPKYWKIFWHILDFSISILVNKHNFPWLTYH
jgi:hypothetical protein